MGACVIVQHIKSELLCHHYFCEDIACQYERTDECKIEVEWMVDQLQHINNNPKPVDQFEAYLQFFWTLKVL